MDAGSRSRARLPTADAVMGEWRRDWPGLTLSPTQRAAHSPLLGEEFHSSLQQKSCTEEKQPASPLLLSL